MAEAILKKVEEILECSICQDIPSEGQMMQCRNGHLACERCMGNEALTRCGVCREPLDNKRIRNLSVELLIEAFDVEVSCKHPNCLFRATKTAMKTHERSCDKRIVECPDPCQENVPLHALLDHMISYTALYPKRTLGTVPCSVDMRYEQFQGDRDMKWACKVYKFQGELFASAFQRTRGIWYAYMYIIGDSEKAEKFKVKMSVGNQDDAYMFCQGQVFPIDAKKADILKTKKGVLSFAQVGMAEEFFKDHKAATKKRIQITYEIIGV